MAVRSKAEILLLKKSRLKFQFGNRWSQNPPLKASCEKFNKRNVTRKIYLRNADPPVAKMLLFAKRCVDCRVKFQFSNGVYDFSISFIVDI